MTEFLWEAINTVGRIQLFFLSQLAACWKSASLPRNVSTTACTRASYMAKVPEKRHFCLHHGYEIPARPYFCIPTTSHTHDPATPGLLQLQGEPSVDKTDTLWDHCHQNNHLGITSQGAGSVPKHWNLLLCCHLWDHPALQTRGELKGPGLQKITAAPFF